MYNCNKVKHLYSCDTVEELYNCDTVVSFYSCGAVVELHSCDKDVHLFWETALQELLLESLPIYDKPLPIHLTWPGHPPEAVG